MAEKKERKSRKGYRFSLRIKTIILIAAFGLALVETAMIYFTLVYDANNDAAVMRSADNLSGVLAKTINEEVVAELKDMVKPIVDASSELPLSDEWGSEKWNAYIAQFDDIAKTDAFLRLREYLREVTANYSDELDCVYLSYVDAQKQLFVYLIDSAEEDACPPGCLDPIYAVNNAILKDPTVGFPAYITNTESYGHLVTSGAPIYKDNEVIAYAMCDLSMGKIREAEKGVILSFFLYMILTNLVICVIGTIVVHFVLIRPVNRLNEVARSYSAKWIDKTHSIFGNLTIKTHDEIAELSHSMKRMESDVYDKINELTAINKELTDYKEEMTRIQILANTDALTGVKSKIAYNVDMEEIDKKIASGTIDKFGLAMIDLNDLKVINDTLGHDHGDIALVNLANIISTVFSRSPVYRFGGDEFVVLLQGSDYQNADILVLDFVTRIDALGKKSGLALEEKASASIGYSAFDKKKDHSVEDVFKRADEAMYKRKRAMKDGKK